MTTHHGLTLDRYLAERGPLEPAQVTRAAIQVAQQIGSAGSVPVLPARILLGNDGAVHLLPPPREDLSLPTVVEFPAYISPEETRGSQPDVRSSLYSLGCTLFELLTGHPPFTAKDPKSLLRAHREEPVPDVRKSVAKVPDSLAETISELLEKDPELRIQTADELIRRLRQGLGAGAAPRPHAAQTPRAAPAGTAAAGAPADPIAEVPRRLLATPSLPAAARGNPRSLKRGIVRPGAASAAKAQARLAGRSLSARSPQGRALAGRRPALGNRRGQTDLGFEDGLAEEELLAPVGPEKKTYPFTIAGVVLGFILGLVLIYWQYNKTEAENRAFEKTVYETRTKEVRKDRKTGFDDQVKSKEGIVKAQLERFKSLSLSAAAKRDFLENALDTSCEAPSAHLLAKELLALGFRSTGESDADGGSGGPETDDDAAAFKKQEGEAEALFKEGKWSEARDRMYRDFRRFQPKHGSRVRDFMSKCDAALTSQWEADKEKANSLAQHGEPEKALEILEKAKVYGDTILRKEADRMIESIQLQVSIAKESETSTDATKDSKDAETDLDKEFDEFKSKAGDSDSSEEKPKEGDSSSSSEDSSE